MVRVCVVPADSPSVARPSLYVSMVLSLTELGGLGRDVQAHGTFKDAEREEMEHFEEHLASVDAAKQKETTDVTMDVEPTSESIDELTDRNSEWRKELRASLKPKERTAIERAKMPELDPVYRATTRTEEVNIGLTKEMAMTEAKRCLDCPKPSCMEGCPVSINIPSFVKNIERGQFLAAAKVLKNTSALPAVCGRVCPQEKQCESKCVHLKMGHPAVAIGYLERFAADYERQSGNISVPEKEPRMASRWQWLVQVLPA